MIWGTLKIGNVVYVGRCVCVCVFHAFFRFDMKFRNFEVFTLWDFEISKL